MSFEGYRIGHESGEWFERYVEAIFRFAGFATERDRLFLAAVKHEIDVWAQSDFAEVAVECKDWNYVSQGNIKKEFDAFITKVSQVGASTGVFAISAPARGNLQRFREYLRQNRLTFWDSKDVEKWHRDIQRFDKSEYQKRLCDSLGIAVREATTAEKTVKLLRVLGKAALKSAKIGAKVSMKIGEELDIIEKPRRRRSRRRARR